MFSSSFADFCAWLTHSFNLLRRDAEVWYRACCGHLAGRSVAISVDDESVVLHFDAGSVFIARSTSPASVSIRTDRQAILAVLSGRSTLQQAALDGTVEILGPLEVLADLLEALRWYVHGAVRTRSLADHLALYTATR